MGKASWRTPSLVALALLVALLAAAMVTVAAEEEQGSAAPTGADADAQDDGDGAPAPAPASEEHVHKSIGAKAKEGLHTVMAGISKGKNKFECKVLGKHCEEAPSAQ